MELIDGVCPGVETKMGKGRFLLWALSLMLSEKGLMIRMSNQKALNARRVIFSLEA